MKDTKIKIGLAGCGALGSIVYKALQDGIEGYELVGISDLKSSNFSVPNMSFDQLAENCDLIIECLPPEIVPELAKEVLGRNKHLMMISACALLLFPEIYDLIQNSKGRVLVPSGALSGLDAVSALSYTHIEKAKIASTKPPAGFKNAPHVIQNDIKLDKIKEKTLLFSGNAFEAAQAFPANINVAASLSLAGIGPKHTEVEVWADPNAAGNAHEITVIGKSSTIISRVENQPDPDNPKSSMLAGYSIIAALKKQTEQMTVV